MKTFLLYARVQENRRENRRGLDQLATEFEKWEGGWEVWKFKEWAADAHSKAMTSPGMCCKNAVSSFNTLHVTSSIVLGLLGLRNT